MCLIVRYSVSVPQTAFADLEPSNRLPHLPESEYLRSHEFAQQKSAIVLACMLACRSFLPERIFADRQIMTSDDRSTATSCTLFDVP